MASPSGLPKQSPSPKLSRRRFLQVAGVTLGGAAVACFGLNYVGGQLAGSQPAPIATPDYTFGEENSMSQRVLVAYATSTGSTIGVAAAIGKTLGARGLAVDVKPIQNNPKLEGYQAVILGSAVHGARWLPEAVTFVGDNQAALNRVPVAAFCVHIMNLGADGRSRNNRRAYLEAVRALVSPVDEAYFAGKGMDAGTTSGLGRWMGSLFQIPEGDHRDWNKIQAWADALTLVPVAS